MDANNPAGTVSRRRTLLAAGILLTFASLRKGWNAGTRKSTIECGPEKPGEPVKLLGQDGNLVEVDPSRIRMVKKKASNSELRAWINKKPIHDTHSMTES